MHTKQNKEWHFSVHYYTDICVFVPFVINVSRLKAVCVKITEMQHSNLLESASFNQMQVTVVV